MTPEPPLNKASSNPSTNRLTFWTRLAAFACLVLACWHGAGYTTKMDDGELFWKVFYGLFVGTSLWVLAFSAGGRNGRSRWWWFDVMACTYVFVPLMQLTIHAPRPAATSLPHLNGFPSGHMVSSFALAWLVSQLYPKLGPAWFGGAVLIGWARLVTQDHFAYQVVAGAIFGAFLAWRSIGDENGVLLPRLWNWIQARSHQTPAQQ